MSLRTEKISELLKEIISDVLLRKVQDKRIGFVSVTAVEVAPDLSEAFVYVSIMGDEKIKKNSMEALRKAAKHVRYEVGQEITFKHTPKIFFRQDDSLERGSAIIAKLNELKKSER